MTGSYFSRSRRGGCNESDYSGSIIIKLSTREVTCSSKSEMEEEMHATKDGFRYVGVRGPGRRSNTCSTKLIVGGVAVLCLVVLVLVVAVAVGVALGIRGSLKT